MTMSPGCFTFVTAMCLTVLSISKFFSHFTLTATAQQCWSFSLSLLIKRGARGSVRNLAIAHVLRTHAQSVRVYYVRARGCVCLLDLARCLRPL